MPQAKIFKDLSDYRDKQSGKIKFYESLDHINGITRL